MLRHALPRAHGCVAAVRAVGAFAVDRDRKKSAPVFLEERPEHVAVRERNPPLRDFVQRHELEVAFLMRRRKAIQSRLELEEKHQPVGLSLVALLGHDPRKMKILRREAESRFLEGLPRRALVRGLADPGLQLAPERAPESPVGILAPMEHEHPPRLVEGVHERRDFVGQLFHLRERPVGARQS